MRSTLGNVFTWASALMAIMASPSTAAPLQSEDTSPAIIARDTTPWIARHGMTSAFYQSEFDRLANEGFRLNYVSGYAIDNDPRFAGIWEQKQGPDWVAKHGLTSAQYQKQFDKWNGKGFRLRVVNGYTVGGKPRFAAIWDKSTGGDWIAHHDMTSDQYQAVFDEYNGQGFRLKHVSGYAKGKQALYAALWEKSESDIEWIAHHGLTSSEYQARFDEYLNAGFRLIHVDGYAVNNVDYYAAIWDRSASGNWVARHGISSDEYQSEFNKYTEMGFRLKVVSGYTLNSNQDRYAALFVQE